MVNTSKIKKEKTEVLNEKSLTDYKKLSYSWDGDKGIIYVKLPNNGKDYQIAINAQE